MIVWTMIVKTIIFISLKHKAAKQEFGFKETCANTRNYVLKTLRTF